MQFEKFGFKVETVSGKTSELGLCETEYEKKFIAAGMEIFALIAKKIR